jgi:hypothetical protein
MLFAYNSCEVIFQVDAPVEFVVGLVGAQTHTHLHLGFEHVDSPVGDAAGHSCLGGADIAIEARLLTRRRLRLRIHILFIKKQFFKLKKNSNHWNLLMAPIPVFMMPTKFC